MKKNNQIMRVDKTRGEESFFTQLTTIADTQSVCGS